MLRGFHALAARGLPLNVQLVATRHAWMALMCTRARDAATAEAQALRLAMACRFRATLIRAQMKPAEEDAGCKRAAMECA